MKLSAILPALVLGLTPLANVRSAELQTAAQVVAALEEARKKSSTGSEDSPASQLKSKLEAFATTAPSMSPTEAAQGWLDLFKTWREQGPDRRASFHDREESGFNALVSALPPPPAWNALKAKLSSDPMGDTLQDQLLAMFAATLNEDPVGQWKALVELQSLARGDLSKSPSLESLNQKMGGQAGKTLDQLVLQFLSPLLKLSDQPEEILKGLDMQLTAMSAMDEGYHSSLSLPDLVSIAGEAKAETVLKKAITAGVAFQTEGEKTRELASRLVLENLSAVKTPPWGLVDGLSEQNIKLYEALAKKFPGQDSQNQYEQKQAAEFYVLSLILAGKTAAADAWLAVPANSTEASLPHRGLSSVLATGKGKIVLDYLLHALAANPSLPFWGELISLAAQEGRSGEALALAKKFAADKDLRAAKREEVFQLLTTAALADGSVDEGIGLLRERLALLKAQKKPEASDLRNVALKMAELGQLLKRNDLREEGIREALAVKPDTERSTDSELLTLLTETGRTAEAQALIVDILKAGLSQRGYPSSFPIDLSSELTNLAGIYDQAGRSSDVLFLLAEAPWWGAKDLAMIRPQTDFRRVPLGVIAARALVANGDKARAVAVLQETLRRAASNDTAYRMLVDLEGQNALPFLETQAARNRFEERPLIWKATLQLAAGDISGADQTIRAAIAIDPSDGEMGPGDRMRAYTVLADILEKQGKPDDAKIYRGAVEAIRLSEEADKYQNAGLLSQAISMYEKALTYFADAYCIQSRLAVQLADLGDMKKAEDHYRRAYELMPDSFGRMESHCFGCERAFKGEMAESLAEKTFRKMIEEKPAKPQTYYLMGYLRTEQGRPADALPFFQKAVELDPDYINAWQKILGLDDDILLPNKVRNEAVFAILRLNPDAARGALRQVTDLKKMWTVVEKLRSEFPPEKPTPVFPLIASAEKIDAQEQQDPSFRQRLRMMRGEEGLKTPGAVLTEQEVIQEISRALTNFSQMGI